MGHNLLDFGHADSRLEDKKWLLTDIDVVVVATVLTLAILVESVFPTYAPYFPVYAIVALLIPLALKSYRFGRFRQVMASAWLLTLGIFVLDVIWDQGIWTSLYERFLTGLDLNADPFYSVGAAMDMTFQTISQGMGITLDMAQMCFGLFVLVWAPFGEELFFRGYLFRTLRERHSFHTAALVSAAFFGIRHAIHFFYLWPELPVVAAGVWTVSTFGYGINTSYLYEKTNSLFPPILEHFFINLVWLGVYEYT